MSARSTDLADRLEASADDMITTVENLSDSDWVKVAPEDGRPINVIVDHVAQSHQAVFMLAEMIIADKPLPPITMDLIHAANAEHAEGSSAVTKEVALVALRVNAETAAAKIRELDDADLDRSAPFTLSESGSITVDAVIEHVMIAHANHHLESIRAAL